MNAKTATVLIFGLVFQLSLIVPRLAAVIADCAPLAESCGCCAGLSSCPCAEEGEPTQKHQPLAPDAGQTLKAPLAKVAGARGLLESLHGAKNTASAVLTASPEGAPTGYTGVRLSVAFCSFVI